MERPVEAFRTTGQQRQLQPYNFVDTICLEEVHGPNDDMFVTECMHVFHFDCIRVWLLNDKTCPNCRQEISSFVTYERTEDDQNTDEDVASTNAKEGPDPNPADSKDSSTG